MVHVPCRDWLDCDRCDTPEDGECDAGQGCPAGTDFIGESGLLRCHANASVNFVQTTIV